MLNFALCSSLHLIIKFKTLQSRDTVSLLFPFSYFFFVFIWWNLLKPNTLIPYKKRRLSLIKCNPINRKFSSSVPLVFFSLHVKNESHHKFCLWLNEFSSIKAEIDFSENEHFFHTLGKITKNYHNFSTFFFLNISSEFFILLEFPKLTNMLPFRFGPLDFLRFLSTVRNVRTFTKWYPSLVMSSFQQRPTV